MGTEIKLQVLRAPQPTSPAKAFFRACRFFHAKLQITLMFRVPLRTHTPFDNVLDCWVMGFACTEFHPFCLFCFCALSK